MISDRVCTTALYAGVGYLLGSIVTAGSDVANHIGGTIGAVTGIAHSLLNATTLVAARKLNLTDDKVHLLNACSRVVIDLAAVAAFVYAGIVPSVVGLAIIGVVEVISVLEQLDKAHENWGLGHRRFCPVP
jgi:hypothetical protein